MPCAWVNGAFIFGSQQDPYLAAFAGSVYIFGAIADLKKTCHGLELGGTELNPMMSTHPDRKELLGAKQKTLDILSLVVGMVIPPIGITVGLDRIGRAIHNNRQINDFNDQ